MVHGKGRKRHQGERLGLGLTKQLEGRKAMGRLKKKNCGEQLNSSMGHIKFEVPLGCLNYQKGT